MSDPTPDPGQVRVGDRWFDSGLHVFAKYGRAPYRRKGMVRARKILEPFEIYRLDGSTVTGEAGDYLVENPGSGEYDVVVATVFETDYIVDDEFDYPGDAEGIVEIDGVQYSTGLDAFAKYERNFYRPQGRVFAMQVNAPFSVEYQGDVHTGDPGDYLAGPDENGAYFIIPQAEFEEDWELAGPWPEESYEPGGPPMVEDLDPDSPWIDWVYFEVVDHQSVRINWISSSNTEEIEIQYQQATLDEIEAESWESLVAGLSAANYNEWLHFNMTPGATYTYRLIPSNQEWGEGFSTEPFEVTLPEE